MPLGALWIGALAEYANAPFAMYVGALFSLVFAAVLFVLAPWLRRLE
jgi:hypothetical protein